MKSNLWKDLNKPDHRKTCLYHFLRSEFFQMNFPLALVTPHPEGFQVDGHIMQLFLEGMDGVWSDEWKPSRPEENFDNSVAQSQSRHLFIVFAMISQPTALITCSISNTVSETIYQQCWSVRIYATSHVVWPKKTCFVIFRKILSNFKGCSPAMMESR